jgi:hypothetical protein
LAQAEWILADTTLLLFLLLKIDGGVVQSVYSQAFSYLSPHRGLRKSAKPSDSEKPVYG